MFLWVSSVLDLLGRCVCDLDFEEILEEIPDTLNDVYCKSLERLTRDLSKSEKRWVKMLFCWVIMAKRNLAVSELKVALPIAYQIRYNSSRPPTLLENIEAILSRCGSFLYVMDGDGQL